MLSLTILPSSLHALTGLSILAILKGVYPALFALFPVALFGLASRFVRPQYAFIAAAFPIVQPYFFSEIPAVARQEIGLLFFVVLVGAIFDTRLRGRPQWSLTLLLVAGLVVSHYTTTYITIAILAACVLIQLAVAAVWRAPRLTAPMLLALVATAVGAGVWYGVVTQSSSNLASFAANVEGHGLDLLPTASQRQGLFETWLSSNTSSRISASRYEAQSTRDAKRRPYIHPLVAASNPRYALHDAKIPGESVRIVSANDAVGNADLVVNQLFTVLAIIGAFALALRRREGSGLRIMGFLGAATLLVLVFMRVSGTAANAYNQERALLQAMVILAVCMAVLLEWSGDRWRWVRRALPALAAVALAAVFGRQLGTPSGGLRRGARGEPV